MAHFDPHHSRSISRSGDLACGLRGCRCPGAPWPPRRSWCAYNRWSGMKALDGKVAIVTPALRVPA